MEFASDGWESMPDHLLMVIFEKLSSSNCHQDLFSASWVCKSWHSACRSACANLFLFDGEDTLNLDRFSTFIKKPQEFSKLLRKAIAEHNTRTPTVKNLSKLRADLINLEGFIMALFCYLRELKETSVFFKRETKEMTELHVAYWLSDRNLKILGMHPIG